MRIKHAVVVITGASSGIGRATALALASRKAIVVLAARGDEALTATADQVRARGGEPLAVPLDVTDPAAVRALADRVVNRFGRIDAWINCAAVAVFGPTERIPHDDAVRVFETNILGTFQAARAALPHMRQRGRGVLVNVSSVLGLVPQPYNAPYCMSKAAVRSLGGSLRQELAAEGVRKVHVCTVLPSTVDTPLWENAGNWTGHAIRAVPPVYSADRIATAIVRVLRHPRPELIVGPAGKATVLALRAAPHLTEAVMGAYTKRTLLRPSVEAPKTSGNLHTPSPGAGAVAGPYHAKARTALRRAMAAAAVTGALAGTATLARRRAGVR